MARPTEDCFIVTSHSPLDDEWEERDKEIYLAAGRRSDYSSAGSGDREHRWAVYDFADAQWMRKRLEKIPSVVASIREK